MIARPRHFFSTFIATCIATGAGSGFFPRAPGTAGSVVAAVLIWFLHGLPDQTLIAFWVLVALVGIWATRVFDESNRTSDNSKIVIDEFLGMAITTIGIQKEILPFVLAFVFFRIFDIFKFPPVRNLDAWSKKQDAPYLKAFGVIADDLAAGVQAFFCLKLTLWIIS